MKTFTLKSKNLKHNWYTIDATGKVLGRLASLIAKWLQGKHKSEYTPHIDSGDYIIVLNAKKIVMTGTKYYNKRYYHHTGYVGGIKNATFKYIINHYPERVIEIAVKGMLPNGPLGRSMFSKLKVYAGNEHKHIAQKPQILNV